MSNDKKNFNKNNLLKDYKFGFHDKIVPIYQTPKGLSQKNVYDISWLKKEPRWMLNFRLEALKIFEQKPLPSWGGDLSSLNFEEITYYLKSFPKKEKTWDEVPLSIKKTFDKLGIPETERKYLAGVETQYDSEVIYGNLKKELTNKGVIFTDTDSALKKYPELFKEYFATVIPIADNKFASLNSAFWSGGTFIYIPKNVKLDLPLQAYFRINAANMGQFERTLIIADEGSFVHYIEGCFLSGVRIKTNQGEKLIENIKVGDEVFTHKGIYHKVYHVMKRSYKGKIYNIKYYGDSGAKLQVTKEHPLLICKRIKKEYRNFSFKPEWTTADQVNIGDYLVYPLYKNSDNKFQTNKSYIIPFGYGRYKSQKNLNLNLEPDFYRLVGYYLAEGHIEKEHYLTFTFNIKEKELIDDVELLLKKYFNKDAIKNKIRNNGQTIILCSTLAARYFSKEFGSTNRTKYIPSWMLDSPTSYLEQLIKGMWIGDGSYDKKNFMFRYSTVTRSLVLSFRDILLKLSIISSINSQPRNSPKQIMHNVIISRPDNTKFGKIVDILTKNGRKEESPFYLDENYIYFPIKSIEIEEKDDFVYNFSVETDESYIGEGVISHNCTAPIYKTASLHAAVVEIIVKNNARVRYTTIQNWSKNVYNLVTKRAKVYDEGIMEWVDGNLGSRLTMKYPACYLLGRKAHGEVLSVAFAGADQHQDAGAKIIHNAPETTSQIISKSISKDGGRTSYRGLLQINKGAVNSKSKVTCDALILDPKSRSDTYPLMKIYENKTSVEHEAFVSKIGQEQLFYLQSRGLTKTDASSMIVNGFIEPIVKELPMEYAVELNRLISMEMEGSVG